MNNKYDANGFQSIADGIDIDNQRKFFKGKLNLLKLDDMPDFRAIRINTESSVTPKKAPSQSFLGSLQKSGGNSGQIMPFDIAPGI